MGDPTCLACHGDLYVDCLIDFVVVERSDVRGNLVSGFGAKQCNSAVGMTATCIGTAKSSSSIIN